jgi:NAD(P)-dependent dehydrogenase (short-subunit alcohol dehydrogenase family)
VKSGVPEAFQRFDLSGRVALVTGASSGLGEGLARGLASAGARVAVVARRHDRLVKLADQIGGMAIGGDLLDLALIGEIVPQIAGELGGQEILVNVAGHLFSHEPAEREPLEAIRQTLDLNLIAPFRLAQEVFPHMLAGRGSIVSVSSISGHVGIPGIPQAC